MSATYEAILLSHKSSFCGSKNYGERNRTMINPLEKFNPEHLENIILVYLLQITWPPKPERTQALCYPNPETLLGRCRPALGLGTRYHSSEDTRTRWLVTTLFQVYSKRGITIIWKQNPVNVGSVTKSGTHTDFKIRKQLFLLRLRFITV